MTNIARAKGGQTLVEFALALPLLFLLFINAVNFGGFLFAWITVGNAVRSAGDYMVMAGATVPSTSAPPSASQVTGVVQDDISSLLNRSSLVVRICQRSPSNSATVSCQVGAPGDFPNPDADARSEASLYVTAWVDVRYTYQPLIPLFSVPGLNMNLTLPPTTVRRQSVMRMLQ